MRKLMWLGLLFIAVAAQASNKVGNGDDGVDLEGMTKVTSGKLFETRDKATELLTKLNVAGVPGLGNLVPEVAHADLYLAAKDVSATLPSDQGTYHASWNGLVYARTFPQPHAATRFFPVATDISPAQLVALHVHEGLHRALPATVREDEGAVASITLAITTPDATHDRVREVTARYVSDTDLEMSHVPAAVAVARPMPASAPVATEAEEAHFKQPSNVAYTFRNFYAPTQPANFPISNMHIVSSELYPFGGGNTPIGFGIAGSFIRGPSGNQTGPLGLSGKMRLWNKKGFDIGLWGQTALNVLSAEELKNSPFGRDVFTLGVSMKKQVRNFYVENYLSYDFGGQSNQVLGAVTYHYNYGGVIDVKVRAGTRLWLLDFGGFAELHLAEHFKVQGGAFNEDFGRYRILSAGPEVTFANDDFAITLNARFLLDSTKNANFDFLGNLMGPGVSQGSVGLTGRVFF